MRRLVVAAGLAGLAGGTLWPGAPSAQAPGAPTAYLENAPPLAFANDVDSNSPAVWSLVGGRWFLYVFNSTAGQASQSRGLSLDRLTPLNRIRWSGAAPHGGAWFEAVLTDPASNFWYGYYHQEREDVVCPGTGKVLPRIGAARSSDRGLTWRDLGTVIEAPPNTEHCTTANHYFVGGVGDFSVMLDPDSQFLYFFYTQYLERGGAVGVTVARMNWADRNSPTRRAQVWNGSAWLPGGNQRVLQSNGSTATQFVYRQAAPFVPAADSWDGGSSRVDAFWGPAVHWNTSLQSYVMLLNRAGDAQWKQQGVYVSFGARLDDPRTWTTPQLLLAGGRWYPQVIGLESDGTDKRAGATARFFMSGSSTHLIKFAREDPAGAHD